MKKHLLLTFAFFSFLGFSQSYPPAAGEEGTTAIPFDSPSIVAWASGAEIFRGYINIEDTAATFEGSNRASFGSVEDAIGPASGNTTEHIVSLGDSGIAILTFEKPITNGPGFDFVVFENGVTDDFLELAHVEVSSDGENFVRFPSHSLTQTDVPLSSFGTIQASQIYNLAGKYRVGFGTPFDLEELKDSPDLDISKITHVKIIDVVGSLGEKGTTDSYGNKINDPFPTPFHSGGFDLGGVGVLHEYGSLNVSQEHFQFSVFPNPSKGNITISAKGIKINQLIIFNQFGQKVVDFSGKKIENKEFSLSPGIYFVHGIAENRNYVKRIVVQ